MRARDIIKNIRTHSGILTINVTVPIWGGFGHFLESTPWTIIGTFTKLGSNQVDGRVRDRGYNRGILKIYHDHLIMTAMTSYVVHLGSQVVYKIKLRPYRNQWIAELIVADKIAEYRSDVGKRTIGRLGEITADVIITDIKGVPYGY